MGGGKLSQEEVTKTIDFCFTAFEPTANEEEKQKVIKSLRLLLLRRTTKSATPTAKEDGPAFGDQFDRG